MVSRSVSRECRYSGLVYVDNVEISEIRESQQAAARCSPLFRITSFIIYRRRSFI